MPNWVDPETEGIMFKQVMEMTALLALPNTPISPADVHRGAHGAGVAAVQSALPRGATPADCVWLMESYKYLGERIGLMFAPGGPLYGATLSVGDEGSAGD